MVKFKLALLKDLNLPPLPRGRSWQVKEFLNNELQAYEPGSRVTLYVEVEKRVLGLPIRWRDTSFPAYVVGVNKDAAYFEETTRLMMSQHQEYVVNHNERAL